MKVFKFLFVLTIGLFLVCTGIFAQNVLAKPAVAQLVTDIAGVLTPSEKAALENKLVAIDDSSSNQIAVVILPTLDGYPIEEYAVKLFREWGIGNKKTNNGVLLLVAINDRKVRIEVGYGLEGAIPDITANSIINNDIKPAFKAGAYFEGIDKATDNIAKAAVGEYKVARQKKDRGDGGNGLLLFVIIAIVIVVIVGRRDGGSGGSNIGGGGFSDIATGMLLGSLLGGGGRRGGDWGGSGGGFGGGGFGGFGGGSSGGGGASGGW
ncbi:MAG: hypothetical protein RLZ56_1099 [Bacteroidota bacterium]|jgi:uncharacterized protein